MESPEFSAIAVSMAVATGAAISIAVAAAIAATTAIAATAAVAVAAVVTVVTVVVVSGLGITVSHGSHIVADGAAVNRSCIVSYRGAIACVDGDASADDGVIT